MFLPRLSSCPNSNNLLGDKDFEGVGTKTSTYFS
jgi:hypothetical protein